MGLAWGGALLRDGSGAWRALKKLDRSPAPAARRPPQATPTPSVFDPRRGSSCPRCSQKPPIQGCAPGPRGYSSHRRASAPSFLSAFSTQDSISPSCSQKTGLSLSGNKCSLLVAVPAVTKADRGAARESADRADAASGGRYRLLSPTCFSVQPSSPCGLCRPRSRPTLLPGLGRQGTARLRTRSFLPGKPGSSPVNHHSIFSCNLG